MKKIIYYAAFFLLLGCERDKTPYEIHLEKEKLLYCNRPDYWARMKKIKLPENYSLEEKLRLVAHGFDPHVRLSLAAQLWDSVKGDNILIENLAVYMNLQDPALAWASAWTFEKCGNDLKLSEALSVYKRKDVIEFEDKYHQ